MLKHVTDRGASSRAETGQPAKGAVLDGRRRRRSIPTLYPEGMVILFAHGAGLGASSPWMRRWASLLGDLGDVRTFEYPYMAAGRKRPDRHDVLLRAHRDALDATGADRVVLIGKSMGSRIGCHLAVEAPERVERLVCLGYPLVGASGKVRDEVLLALRTPILFVQGTRDRLCPLDRLAEVRDRMTAPSELHVVEGGDHSLELRKGDLAGRSRDAVDRDTLGAIARFLG